MHGSTNSNGASMRHRALKSNFHGPRSKLPRSLSRLLKTLSESFDKLRTNGERFQMIKKFPFMLSLSKHVLAFFSKLLV
jgi:hypothetical protein